MMLRRKSQVSKMQNGRSVYLTCISDFLNVYGKVFFRIFAQDSSNYEKFF